MEFTFSALKQKDVINLIDGKHLGRVCDITFSFPENNVLGFTVTGCKGFRFSKQEVFLPIKSVVKIGTDAPTSVARRPKTVPRAAFLMTEAPAATTANTNNFSRAFY